MGILEKSSVIWNQICEKIASIPQLSGLTLSTDNSDGWCDGASWYGENILSDDDYLHITPIEKRGREVYGTISYSIGFMDTYGTYRNYEEFEMHLSQFLEVIA